MISLSKIEIWGRVLLNYLYWILRKLLIQKILLNSNQTYSDKVVCQKGNSPQYRLRYIMIDFIVRYRKIVNNNIRDV